LPVIDPAGEEDHIFRHIAEHRAAAVHYDRCVTVEQEAEGKVSDDEYFYLKHNTSNAWDQMMLFARCVILTRPITRRGLIHQVRYLVSQFNDLEGCEGGCMYLPDEIGERPWAMAFLQSLAAGLRKMAGEFDPANEGSRQ
jgi:phage pi2 protein 07